MKKLFLILLIAIIATTSMFAQGAVEAEEKAEVYFLNFKPEIADVYTNIVEPAFEEETGIPLKVVTAASNQYATTLKSEMAKSNPPTIFQTNGYVGLEGSLNEVSNLADTDFYKILADKSMALYADGNPVAVPYAVEGYGIIYNAAILDAYFATAGAKASSIDDINNFATLKAVVEDMQAKKDELGIEGVFASTSMSPGNDWRWQTHLANVPIYAEFKDKSSASEATMTGLAATSFDFAYGDEFKAIWDLYLNNSTTAKGLVGAKSVDDSMAEFALGRAAMVQNGNWGAGQILGVPGVKVANEDIKFLPIYIGLEGEESQGLCVGTENFLCINTHASEAAQANADKFLTWLFSSETGKAIVKEHLGFITPFNTFEDDELPTDPLAKDVINWMNKDGKTSLPWTFSAIPSEQWKADFSAGLLSYINGDMDWAEVEEIVKASWTKEAEIAGR